MSTSSFPQSIGVLGLGIIGAIWARHYHEAGKLAGAWNRTPQPEFPTWKATAAEVARAADAVQIVVADPPAVAGVLDAILPELDGSKMVIQSSTIDPDSSSAFRERVLATGAAYVEAPFTGSRPAAEAKQTVFYLGADEALCEAVEPLLALVSAHRLRIGSHRQACALKLAMNLNISAQMQALAEARAICARSGIGDDVFFDALSRNVSCSGLTRLKEPVLRAADFRPMFSVKHMHKDMRLARGMAESGGCEILQTVSNCLAEAEQAGWGDEDFAALAKLLPHEVRRGVRRHDAALDRGDMSPRIESADMSAHSKGGQGDMSPRIESADMSAHSTDWHHAPPHRLIERGVYMVTAGTLQKQHVFHDSERLDLLHDRLIEYAAEFGWELQAWAVFSNHYHFVAASPEDPSTLGKFLGKLHMKTAQAVNLLDGMTGRKVWYQFWESRITFENSYWPRLRYVQENPVRHGLVPVANQYPWCSAGWFERTAEAAVQKKLASHKIDQLDIPDDY